jgi:hypothetical protein
MLVLEKQIAANHMKVGERIVRKRGSLAEYNILEGQIMFFEFPRKIHISLEPKTIVTRVIEVNTATIINVFCC